MKKKQKLIKLSSLVLGCMSCLVFHSSNTEANATPSRASHIGTFEENTTFMTSSENGINPGLWIEVMDRKGNLTQYTSEDGIISIPNTKNGTYVTQAKLLGKTKYRDQETNELLDTWEEGRKLTLESTKKPSLLTSNTLYPIQDGLVSWLDGRDGNNKETVWKDRTNNGNNAQLIGFQFDDTSGWTGNSLRFDGKNSYGELSPFIQDDFTINMYVDIKAGYGEPIQNWYKLGGLFDADVASVRKDFGLAVDGDGRIACGIGSPDTTIKTPSPHKNEKILISFVRDKTNGKFTLYINGEKQAEGNSNKDSLNQPEKYILGAIQTGRSFKPKFDCFSILVYNRVLTEEEINFNYLYEKSINREEGNKLPKTSILNFDEEITLKGIGNEQDTLDLITGELIQKINEVTFNGSDNEEWRISTLDKNRMVCECVRDRKVYSDKYYKANLLCDKFKTLSYSEIFGTTGLDGAFGIAPQNENKNLHLKSDVYNDLNSFKQWLSQNPTTVQYILETEITSTFSPKSTQQFPQLNDSFVQLNGIVTPVITSIKIPNNSLTFTLDPNQEKEKQFIAPEFEVVNESNAPLSLTLQTFEQTTDVLNDVLPSKYNSWEGLTKEESKDFALGLVAKLSDAWVSYDKEPHYVINSSDKFLGTIKPKRAVGFEFKAYHGQAFSEVLNPSYRFTLIFDLLK